MEQIPVIGFAAWSGTGKTTLIEKILRELKSQGYRVAVLKHDAHKFEIDREGKDSWRFTNAGADMMLISSGTKTAIVEQRPRSFEENLSMIHDVDIILVEGYKQEAVPRIGISRKATGKGLPHPVETCAAVVTDDESIASASVPVFGLEDTARITEFIKKIARI
jgi:molybdopterin-guanine dinucleotide biosynthesis protein B